MKNIVGLANMVSEVKSQESVKAKKQDIVNIDIDSLVPYPKNNEDVENIEDLLESMQKNGFTDPIEVTTYGMEDGKYQILSGHRRTAAWKKLNNGKVAIKAIVVDKVFHDDNEVWNYVLMANAQRTEASNPMLIVQRYKEHSSYCQAVGIKNIREEVAKRLNLSKQNADRYANLSKAIKEIAGLVFDGVVGVSSIQKICTKDEETQKKIYKILMDSRNDGKDLTRDFVNNLVDVFLKGFETWDSIKEAMFQKEPVNGIKEDIQELPASVNNSPAPEINKINENKDKGEIQEVLLPDDSMDYESIDYEEETWENEESEDLLENGNSSNSSNSEALKSVLLNEKKEIKKEQKSVSEKLIEKITSLNSFLETQYISNEESLENEAKVILLKSLNDAIFNLAEAIRELDGKLTDEVKEDLHDML